MQPCKARVARGDSIVPFGLQMPKESSDTISREVAQRHCLYPATVSFAV
jgi:hypothetical protein